MLRARALSFRLAAIQDDDGEMFNVTLMYVEEGGVPSISLLGSPTPIGQLRNRPDFPWPPDKDTTCHSSFD
jgi:hypothetical protein